MGSGQSRVIQNIASKLILASGQAESGSLDQRLVTQVCRAISLPTLAHQLEQIFEESIEILKDLPDESRATITSGFRRVVNALTETIQARAGEELTPAIQENTSIPRPVPNADRQTAARNRTTIQVVDDIVADNWRTWKASPVKFFNQDAFVLEKGSQLCSYFDKIDSETILYRLRRRFIAQRFSLCRNSWPKNKQRAFIDKFDEGSRHWAGDPRKCKNICLEGSFYNRLAERFTLGVFFVLKLSPTEYIISQNHMSYIANLASSARELHGSDIESIAEILDNRGVAAAAEQYQDTAAAIADYLERITDADGLYNHKNARFENTFNVRKRKVSSQTSNTRQNGNRQKQPKLRHGASSISRTRTVERPRMENVHQPEQATPRAASPRSRSRQLASSNLQPSPSTTLTRELRDDAEHNNSDCGSAPMPAEINSITALEDAEADAEQTQTPPRQHALEPVPWNSEHAGEIPPSAMQSDPSTPSFLEYSNPTDISGDCMTHEIPAVAGIGANTNFQAPEEIPADNEAQLSRRISSSHSTRQFRTTNDSTGVQAAMIRQPSGFILPPDEPSEGDSISHVEALVEDYAAATALLTMNNKQDDSSTNWAGSGAFNWPQNNFSMDSSLKETWFPTEGQTTPMASYFDRPTLDYFCIETLPDLADVDLVFDLDLDPGSIGI